MEIIFFIFIESFYTPTILMGFHLLRRFFNSSPWGNSPTDSLLYSLKANKSRYLKDNFVGTFLSKIFALGIIFSLKKIHTFFKVFKSSHKGLSSITWYVSVRKWNSSGDSVPFKEKIEGKLKKHQWQAQHCTTGVNFYNIFCDMLILSDMSTTKSYFPRPS